MKPIGSIQLTNGTVLVGVEPALGARVVDLRVAGGDNLFDVDPRLLRPPFPPPAVDTPFRPWNGRIVWSGPQASFWAQQDLKPEKKREKAAWPPDPFNETGRFEVAERTPTSVRLRGATSPVTGLALDHEFEITGLRRVRMRTTATNFREEPVSWDLWPNTRVRTNAFPYVPLDPQHTLRTDGPPSSDAAVGPYPTESRDGWLGMPPGHEPEGGYERLWAKAYVRPAQGLIACFAGKHLLLITAPVVPKERLHPEHALIEIYRAVGRGTDILELEMHGPYETLAPGASMSFEQVFEVLDYDGAAEGEAHRARLAELAP